MCKERPLGHNLRVNLTQPSEEDNMVGTPRSVDDSFMGLVSNSDIVVESGDQRSLARQAIMAVYKAAGFEPPRTPIDNKSMKTRLTAMIMERYGIEQDSLLMPLGEFTIDPTNPNQLARTRARVFRLADTITKRGNNCKLRIRKNGQISVNPVFEGVTPEQLADLIQTDGIHKHLLDPEGKDGIISNKATMSIFPEPKKGFVIDRIQSGPMGVGWSKVTAIGAFNVMLGDVVSIDPDGDTIEVSLDMVFNGRSTRSLNRSDLRNPAFCGSTTLTDHYKYGGLTSPYLGGKALRLRNLDGALELKSLADHILAGFVEKYSLAISHLWGSMVKVMPAGNIHMLQVMYRTEPKTGELSFFLYDWDGPDTKYDHEDKYKGDTTIIPRQALAGERVNSRLFAGRFGYDRMVRWLPPMEVKRIRRNHEGRKEINSASKILSKIMSADEAKSIARQIVYITDSHTDQDHLVWNQDLGKGRIFKPGTNVSSALAEFCRNIGLLNPDNERTCGKISIETIEVPNHKEMFLIHTRIEGYDTVVLAINGKVIDEELYLKLFNPITHRALMEDIAVIFGKNVVPAQYLHLREGD
ncbi:hypothetical protein COX08_02635 [Candidatus Beckwithbacteria bacterium CG23_combo_of_CG06-09_8_20_14_all_34_8]|uniref:Uncharacterized protein n=1 Tax=Candidatus Beckwithbacteria bacterium CG23_combo_of_CG06-09_8_20_14_all_34_8 TaxID=1974497 RepID=A0A2H0B651_9BACT|nr:MAG: hypothetical protein COX08_02635 [Candidatus Beckwithbacteria bacterium CG23_combo_of_CG06-09_8_20_14_all_34_8]